MPIESFVTTLIDWTLFLTTRTKLASVGFVAARNCMQQQVLDDAKSLPNCGRSRSATTCAPNIVHSNTPYYKALLQYHKVLQSTTPALFRAPVLLCASPYYQVLLQYSHMKRHLQCAEQQKSPSNVTKHCGCHEKWPSKIRQKFAENSWNVIYLTKSCDVIRISEVSPPKLP